MLAIFQLTFSWTTLATMIKIPAVSPFFHRNMVHVYLEKSSILIPLFWILNGPHKSMWCSTRGLAVLTPILALKDDIVFLLHRHHNSCHLKTLALVVRRPGPLEKAYSPIRYSHDPVIDAIDLHHQFEHLYTTYHILSIKICDIHILGYSSSHNKPFSQTICNQTFINHEFYLISFVTHLGYTQKIIFQSLNIVHTVYRNVNKFFYPANTKDRTIFSTNKWHPHPCVLLKWGSLKCLQSCALRTFCPCTNTNYFISYAQELLIKF